MMRMLRFIVRWLRPLTWRWAIVRWRQRLRQRPLAQWIRVHGIYVDGRDLLTAPMPGSAFSEVLATELHEYPSPIVRSEIMLSVENLGPKSVLFQAAAFLRVVSNGSDVVPFGPKQLAPGEFAELTVKVLHPGCLLRVMIPSYTSPPSKVTS